MTMCNPVMANIFAVWRQIYTTSQLPVRSGDGCPRASSAAWGR